MTYKSFLDRVATQNGLGRATIEHYMRLAFTEIARQLKDGQDIEIDNFGTFKKSRVKAHVLPFDKSVTVPEQDKVTFSNDDTLRGFLNGGETFEMKSKKSSSILRPFKTKKDS